jgi:hypothetical protein
MNCDQVAQTMVDKFPAYKEEWTEEQKYQWITDAIRLIEVALPVKKKTVLLESGGEITLSGDFNLFELCAEDRKFMAELVDKMNSYELQSRAKPTTLLAPSEVGPTV